MILKFWSKFWEFFLSSVYYWVKSRNCVHPSEICWNLMILTQNFISCFRMLNFRMFWWLSIFSRSILVNFRLNWCPQELLFEISLFLVANANFFYSTWLIILKFIKFHLFLLKTFQFEWKKFKVPCEIVANIGLLSEGSYISRLSALKGRGISMSYTKS